MGTSQVDSRGNSSSPAEALSAGGAGRDRVHPEQRHALRFHQQDEEDEAEKDSELPKRSETPHQAGSSSSDVVGGFGLQQVRRNWKITEVSEKTASAMLA